MDKNKWILFFAAIIIIGVIILVLILRREKKPELRPDTRQVKEPFTSSDPKSTVESLKEECWQSYLSYLNAEKRFSLYREVFCNDGILLYLQRLIGFCHYDLRNYEDMEQFRLKAGTQLLGGLFGCINAKMPYNGSNYIIPKEFRYETTKEAYLLNSLADVEAGASREAVTNKLKDKIAARRKDMAELKSNVNNSFYEALWNNSIARLEALAAFYKNELQISKDLPLMKEKLTKLVREAQECINSSGIRFAFYEALSEEEKERYFMVYGSVDDVPAVLRQKDSFLYYKGKLSEKRAAALR